MDTLLIKYSIEGWKWKDCCTSLRPLKPLQLLCLYPHVTIVKIFVRRGSLHRYVEATSSWHYPGSIHFLEFLWYLRYCYAYHNQFTYIVGWNICVERITQPA